MTKNVQVVPYDPTWPQKFEEEAVKIKKALGENCLRVLHIGSTSIPGIAAKPIIDMLPVVQNILKVNSESLEALGYQARGELGMLFRRFFHKGKPTRTHHLHIWEEGSGEIDKHLKFRGYLINHPQEYKHYETLKLDLAKKFSTDRNAYTLGKDTLIQEILQKAGFSDFVMVQALTEREWQAVKHLRQKYFFEHLNIQDPYSWCFSHPAHSHIVLIKGTSIIGYAHIQDLKDSRAALRIIVIDPSYRNQGIGTYFLKKLEKWLAQRNCQALHVQSKPKASSFYERAAYINMPFVDPEGHQSDPKDIEVGKLLKEF